MITLGIIDIVVLTIIGAVLAFTIVLLLGTFWKPLVIVGGSILAVTMVEDAIANWWHKR